MDCSEAQSQLSQVAGIPALVEFDSKPFRGPEQEWDIRVRDSPSSSGCQNGIGDLQWPNDRRQRPISLQAFSHGIRVWL